MNTPERITFQKIGRSILQVLNLERGLFYTILVLLTKPGTAIETYLKKDRTKLVEPVRFSLVVLAITTIVFLSFNGQDYIDGFLEGITDNKEIEKVTVFINVFKKYCNLFLIFILPIIAAFSYSSFKKSGYNGAEHLVINAYVFSFQSLIFISLTLLSSLFPNYRKYGIEIVQTIILLATFYQILIYYQIFKEHIIKVIFKSLLIIILALFLYFILIIASFFILMTF